MQPITWIDKRLDRRPALQLTMLAIVCIVLRDVVNDYTSLPWLVARFGLVMLAALSLGNVTWRASQYDRGKVK